MNRPLVIEENFDFDPVPDRKRDNIIALRSNLDFTAEDQALAQSAVGILSDAQYSANHRDNKIADYWLIIALAILVHGTVVEHLRNMPLAKETWVEPVKPQSKVQISFTQPKPKTVVPPPPKPVVQKPPPPPKPDVVSIKKPPKPKVSPKPVVRAVEPPPQDLPDRVEPVAQVAEPVNTTPPPPPPPPPKVEKVTQPSAGAGYLNNPPPQYPELASERGWEGKVLMKVHVLANGKPDSVNVVKSSGHEVLDEEAVRTVKQWSFVPGKRGDTPIDGYVTVPIAFNLQN